MIRKAITDCFHLIIHEIHKFNGASELLDIMESIISGFAIPLREEYIIFFKNIIIHNFENYHHHFFLFLQKNIIQIYFLIHSCLLKPE